MAYLGQAPNKSVTTPTSQSFNGDGSTTVFTLNRGVNYSEELEVFVDNIQQEPGTGKSYTASGTTLTFDEAPATGTGNIYVIYRGQAQVGVRLEHDANASISATDGTFSGNIQADSYIITGTTSSSFTPVQITSSTSGIGELRFADTTVNAGYVKYEHSNNDMVFATNATERMRLTDDGKLGLGTSAPDSEIHIATPTPKIHLRNTSDSNRGGFIEEDGTDFVLGSNSGVRDVKIKRDGSTGVHVEAGGATTFPSNPMFAARGNTSVWKSNGTGSQWYALIGGTSDSNGTNGQYHLGVNWNTTGTGQNVYASCFSTSTGKFTAPVDGFYIFSISMYLRKTSSATASNYMHPNPRINGSIQNSYQIHGFQSSGAATGTRYESGVSRTDVLYLSKNDTMEYAFYFEGTNWQFYADYLRMSGGLIG